MTLALHGTGIGNGIAIGRAHLITHSTAEITQQNIAPEDIPAEIARFDEAVKRTQAELESLWDSIPANAPAELGAFLSMHLMLLNDVSLSDAPRQLIASECCNAEWALKLQADQLVAQFEEIEEAYLRERKQDVLQVVERVFKNLLGEENVTPIPTSLLDDFILVAHDLSPADMVYFRDTSFSAFVTDIGGVTSHTAILARSLDLPSVIATSSARSLIAEDELLIVDGRQGVVIVNPTEAVLTEYRQRLASWRTERSKLAGLRDSSALTQDGVPVELAANIESPKDVPDVLQSGADGVGLFRSEFLFLGRDTLPDEEEQFSVYREVVEGLKPQPVTIRTMDLGADKNPKWAMHASGDNPALGLCGVRLCLAEPLFFRTQLRAILRASAFGKVRMMFPMISGITELRQALTHLDVVREELKDEGIAFDETMEVGAMIEVPSAALTVGLLARHVDFLSVGTNDLIQYTLAIDRNDESVSHLYDPAHPAVLYLLTSTFKTAAKMQIPVSVCGEMAGDVRMTRLLLGMGLRKFSLNSANLLPVKQIILETNLQEIYPKVAKILRTNDPDKITDLLHDLNL